MYIDYIYITTYNKNRHKSYLLLFETPWNSIFVCLLGLLTDTNKDLKVIYLPLQDLKVTYLPLQSCVKFNFALWVCSDTGL